MKWGLNFFELLSCIIGFYFWYKIRGSFWKWFPIYLAIILVTEFTGKYIMLVLKDQVLNGELYRYFGIPVQFLFFFWLFYQYFSADKERKWPVIGAVIYGLSWLTEIFFLQGVRGWFMSFSYTMGNIVLLVLIILFFIKFINSQEILNYKQSMMFWVSLGLLSFYLGTFPFYALRNTLAVSYPDIFYAYLKINYVLDYLMYVFFTIAFICGRPK